MYDDLLVILLFRYEGKKINRSRRANNNNNNKRTYYIFLLAYQVTIYICMYVIEFTEEID